MFAGRPRADFSRRRVIHPAVKLFLGVCCENLPTGTCPVYRPVTYS